MLDVITIGDAMIAFSPNSTGPMKFVNTFERKIGGAELNFAIGCSRLGLKTGWISRLGKDEFGQYIYNCARGEGIDVSEVQLVEGYPTSVYFKEVMEDGSARSFYYRDKSPTLTLTEEDLNESYFKQAKILHLSGVFPSINPQNIEIIKHAVELAKFYGLKISLDPNIRLRLWSKDEASKVLNSLLPDIDILMAGDEEMEVLIGEKEPKKIIQIVRDIGVPFIAIKQGEKGSVGYSGGEIIHSPAIKTEHVVDTVGAGDGFDAGIIYGILQNWSLDKTLHFGNTIGSMVIGVKGDNEGLPYYEDVEKRLGLKENIER